MSPSPGKAVDHPIVLYSYGPLLPLRFRQKKDALGEAITGLFVAIHHIGSTLIPRMAAKPVHVTTGCSDEAILRTRDGLPRGVAARE